MKISHIEHLGIAVKSIEEALPYYENVLGLKCYNIETVEDQKVKTAFLKVGDTKIELLEPTSPESTIAKFIENKGAGVHHVAFAIEDGVANALAEVEAAGKRTGLLLHIFLIAAQHLIQVTRCDLLEQKVKHTQPQRLLGILQIAVACDQDHCGARHFQCDAPGQFQAIHSGHADIGNQQVRLFPSAQIQS